MKKRIYALIICAVLMLSISVNSVVFAQDDINITVKLDGEILAFDVPPQVINGRTMVPMRAIFEKLGATVEWNGYTETVTSVKGDTTIKLTIGVPSITINQQSPKKLDVAPCVINGRTLVPVRAISEAFNLNVDWIGATSTVLIASTDTNTNSYNQLKDTILSSQFTQKGEGDFYYIGYKPYEQNEMTFIYDNSSNYIFLRYYELRYPEIDFAIIIKPNDKPAFSYTVDPKNVKIEVRGYFPEANKPFVETANEFPEGFDYKSILYMQMGLMDAYMKNVTGQNLSDFGIYYEKN